MNLPASTVILERSTSRGLSGLEIVCIDFKILFKEWSQVECIVNGLYEITQLFSEAKEKNNE